MMHIQPQRKVFDPADKCRHVLGAIALAQNAIAILPFPWHDMLLPNIKKTLV